MKILVIGGTGNLGSRVVKQLRASNHDPVVGSPSTGVDSYTGKGLEAAMQGTEVVIDLANSAQFDEQSSIDFFERTASNLTAAAINGGVKHFVAISIVGADRMVNFGYMKAKIRQEEIVKNSGMPYTIIRSTQFFEFVPFLTTAATQGNDVFAPGVDFQPIAVENVAGLVVKYALGQPLNGTVEIAGPERKPESDFIQNYIKNLDPSKNVILTGRNEYYGVEIPKDGLVPLGEATLGNTHFNDWLSTQALPA